MAANIDGSVEEQSEVSQDGHDAIDGSVTFTRDGTDGTVYARVIDAGGSLVILQSVGRRGDDGTLARLQQRMVDSTAVPR